MNPILQYPVKNVITPRTLKSIRETDPLVRAVAMMDELNISALPVVNEEGAFTGVISKTDIASKRFLELIKQTSLEQLSVKSVMNLSSPFAVYDDQPVCDVISMMHKRHIHRVFVKNADNTIYNLISTTDIIKLLFVDANATAQGKCPQCGSSLKPAASSPHADQNTEEQIALFHHVRESHNFYMEDIDY